MKLALVIPWFGRELKGGAEQQAWQIATRLSARSHQVDVLTTCCRSHQEDWETNHMAAGRTHEPEGFAVHRFPVDLRNREAFDRVCAKLLQIDLGDLRPGVSPLGTDEAATFTDELIRSERLLQFLSDNRHSYDWFIFLPYLYGPIIHGVLITRERAVLQPCLHNEAYAYLPQVAEAFYRSARLLFNSDGEKELAVRLFGPGVLAKGSVVGEGVEAFDLPRSQRADLHRPSHHSAPNCPEKFILYIGRKDAGKNVPLLVQAFERFRSVRPNSDLHLVLVGHGMVHSQSAQILDLGLVSDETKGHLLDNCVALAQPSVNESFSRAMMEAWFCRRPVAVHRRCLATAVAVERCGGGWLAETEDEWAELFARLDRCPATELAERGRKGQQYAKEIADWDSVMQRYEAALEKKAQVLRTSRRKAIHQVLPNMAFGDAISNVAMVQRNYLREQGFDSRIFVRHLDPRVASEAEVFQPGVIEPRDAIIYHHSIGTELTRHVIAHPGPKLLVYHNITPPEFFEPFRPEFAEILRDGRNALQELAQFFPNSVGDSAYNAAELHAFGFKDPQVLPISVDPGKWNLAPDPKLMENMQDGRTNILFVGRIAPNKKQHELVESFAHYLFLDPTARLILIGAAEPEDPYVSYVKATIRNLGLESCVVFAGTITESELLAYYRTSHLYWSMSEHEGFGVPLIESMWFDVPVLAKAASAVPETLGEAALMVRNEPLEGVAAMAYLLTSLPRLRGAVLRHQRIQRQHFTKTAVEKSLARQIERLV